MAFDLAASARDSLLGGNVADNKQGFAPEDFQHNKEIGKGKDSIIYAAACAKLGGSQVAVKVYDKDKVSASKLRAIKREAAMMIYMTRKRVPLVTQFLGAFQDAKHIYIVMELCKGGDLLEKLLKEGHAMSERRVARDVALPLLTALKHLHALSIIHRDIKLENIFLTEDGCLKLGDFGLTMSMKQELAISPVGTVEYMAPEVVALPPVDQVTSGAIPASSITPCTEKVDIWALGVTLYELLTGHLPFEGKDKGEIKAAIAAHQLKALPATLSPACAAFVTAMLCPQPAARPSADDLLRHPFLVAQLADGPPPRVHVSDSATSLNAAWRLRNMEGETSSASGSLPASFTVRHGNNVKGSMPEILALKQQAEFAALSRSGDSQDYIKAGRFVRSDGGPNAMTGLDSPRSPRADNASFQRWSHPLQAPTKSGLSLTHSESSAHQLAAHRADGTALLAQSPGLLNKLAIQLKSIFAPQPADLQPAAMNAADALGNVL